MRLRFVQSYENPLDRCIHEESHRFHRFPRSSLPEEGEGRRTKDATLEIGSGLDQRGSVPAADSRRARARTRRRRSRAIYGIAALSSVYA